MAHRTKSQPDPIKRVRCAVLAKTDQIQTEIELRELEGNRILLLQAREAAVDAAQFAFLEAGDIVVEVKDLSDQQLELEKDLQTLAGRTEDYTEGVAAFIGKRKPVFKGK